MNELIIQGLGLVAAILNISAVQWKKRSAILLSILIAGGFWVVHFSLLGAYTGAALNLAGMIVVTAFFVSDKKKTRPRWLVGACVALMVVAGVLTWKDLTSLLPLVGMIAATFAVAQINEQRIRALSIMTSVSWLGYNIIVHSYVGVGKEIIAIVSILIALWRYRKQGFTEVAVQKNS